MLEAENFRNWKLISPSEIANWPFFIQNLKIFSFQKTGMSLNIIIMWEGILLNETGVWLTFGAYFTHSPLPPPPSLQVVFAQSLIAISVFPWNFTWNLPQCEVAIIFAKNIILDMYRGYFRVVTNISFKIKERAQRVIYFLLTETNKIISPSLHVIFFLLSDGHERYLVNLVLQ